MEAEQVPRRHHCPDQLSVQGVAKTNSNNPRCRASQLAFPGLWVLKLKGLAKPELDVCGRPQQKKAQHVPDPV